MADDQPWAHDMYDLLTRKARRHPDQLCAGCWASRDDRAVFGG